MHSRHRGSYRCAQPRNWCCVRTRAGGRLLLAVHREHRKGPAPMGLRTKRSSVSIQGETPAFCQDYATLGRSLLGDSPGGRDVRKQMMQEAVAENQQPTNDARGARCCHTTNRLFIRTTHRSEVRLQCKPITRMIMPLASIGDSDPLLLAAPVAAAAKSHTLASKSIG